MEQAENNIRKDFTASERVEIARRIEAALAGRVGANQHSPISDDPETGRSDDIAAKSVGWSGGRASVATFQPVQTFAQVTWGKRPAT